jgi:hypothetical protein
MGGLGDFFTSPFNIALIVIIVIVYLLIVNRRK